MQPQAITVSQFFGIINETLTFAYPQVVVEGEVSSFKINQGKFVFFDLKDDANVLTCFMMVHQLKLPLEDGMKIRVVGTPKVTKFSKFSLTVRAIELAGEGELKRAMELLRRKLEREGLFSEARKRPLPRFPARIGLITSGTSAAYSDFIKILGARWGGLEVQLADVSVQGATAPDQIVGALEYFNELNPPVDVVVLIRGGGSLEDLSAFSTEPVARAVAASRTPIVVGVGHEIDTSLADYAADVRAATPTDAARLVVPDRAELVGTVAALESHMHSRLQHSLTRRSATIDRHLAMLERSLRGPQDQTARLEGRLWRSFERLAAIPKRQREQTLSLEHRLRSVQTARSATAVRQVASLERVLRSFDPQATLNRGYAIVRRGEAIIRDPADLQPTDMLVVQLAKGSINTEVRPS